MSFVHSVWLYVFHPHISNDILRKSIGILGSEGKFLFFVLAIYNSNLRLLSGNSDFHNSKVRRFNSKYWLVKSYYDEIPSYKNLYLEIIS